MSNKEFLLMLLASPFVAFFFWALFWGLCILADIAGLDPL